MARVPCTACESECTRSSISEALTASAYSSERIIDADDVRERLCDPPHRASGLVGPAARAARSLTDEPTRRSSRPRDGPRRSPCTVPPEASEH